MGKRMNDGLGQLREVRNVGEVRGIGLLGAVEVVENTQTHAPFPVGDGIGAKLARAMRDRGVVTRVRGDTILLAPPLIVSEEQVDTIVNVVAESIDTVMATQPSR